MLRKDKRAETPKEHKSIRPYQLKVDEEKGIVEEIVAVMGNVDEGDDVIHNGAFAKTIQERIGKIRVLDQHNTDSIMRIVGKPLEMRELGKAELPLELLAEYPEATGGLYAKTQYFMDTPEGKGAFIRARNRAVEYSIGYDPLDIDYSKVTGKDGKPQTVRNLRTIKLYEYSPVLWGMNPATMTLSSKETEGSDEEKPVDVTDKYIRVRVKNPDDFQDDSFKTIDISKDQGIRAVIGKLKGETTTTIQSYLFDKEQWSEGDATKWVDEHNKYIVVGMSEKSDEPDKEDKSINLTDLVDGVINSFYDNFNFMGSQDEYYVREVHDDHLVVCSYSQMGGKPKFFSVPYTFADGLCNFSQQDKWTEGEYVFRPLSAAASPFASMSADESPEVKSGRVLSRRNAEALRGAVDNLVSILKTAGVWEEEEDEEEEGGKAGNKPVEPAGTLDERAALQDNQQSVKRTQAGPQPAPTDSSMSVMLDIEALEVELAKAKIVEVQ